MELNNFLYGFMDMVGEDPRIGPSHISLFLAILHAYKCQQFHSPVSVYSRDLMKQAKIGNRTYHTCIADLKKWGYIQYVPSYNPILGSLIYLLKVEK